MKIIGASETIVVDFPTFLIFGQPGIGKTSLAYSAPKPLVLDADRGAHRAINRRDTLQVHTWADIEELMGKPDALEGYLTIAPDTAGRVLDLMAADIMAKNPKHNNGGSLSLQGFGVLKGRFATWLTRIRELKKNLLLIAHAKEEKNGDDLIIRPDATGASQGEMLKSADFVGYLHMRGRERVLDFNPTDRWFGKSPGAWEPFIVPKGPQATDFMADLFERGKKALGQMSTAGADITATVVDWRTRLANLTVPDELTAAIALVNAVKPEMACLQVRQLLADRVHALGFAFDKTAKRFIDPRPKPETREPELAGAGVSSGKPADDLGF